MIFDVFLDVFLELLGLFTNLLDKTDFINLSDDGDFLFIVAEGGVAEFVFIVFLAAFVYLVADVMLDTDSLVEVLVPHLFGEHVGVVLVKEHQREIGMAQLLVLVVLPKLVVTVVNLIPGVEHAVADVSTQLVDIFLGHGLAAEVDPFAEAFAAHLVHDMYR